MARFSIGEAVGDAFDLIRRRPLAVFIWGLLLLAPVVLSFALMIPAMGEMFANMPESGEAAGREAMADRMFAGMMQLQLVSMLLNIGQMLVMVVVYTAVFRAVLRPQETSAFSLRVSMDELRVAVVGLAIGVGLYAAMLVFILLGAAVGFAVWNAAGKAVTVGVICFMVLVMVVAILVAMARVSMMAPASVLYRDFAFVQGWRLAAGKTLPLFGLMLLVFLMILLVEIVVVVATLAVVTGAASVTDFDWTRMHGDFNPFAGVDAWVAANWYWVLIGGIVGAFLYGLLVTLSIAPFASACRQLAGNQTTSPADEG
ncbi:MAG: hypothetical protein ACXW3K_11460, partial [Brevundimonas sp.]